MQSVTGTQSGFAQVISWALVLASVAVFVFTGSYLALLFPFLYLFLLFTALSWKTVYWVLICVIPLSVTIEIIPGYVSTTVPDEPVTWIFTILLLILVAQNPRTLPAWWFENKITLVVFLQFMWLVVAVAFSSVILLSLKFLLAKIWMLAAFFIIPLWVFRDKKDFKKGFLALLIPILFTVIIILYRQFIQDFRFTSVNKACEIFYYNHVEYAAVLAVFLPLSFIAFSLVKRVSLRLLLGIVIAILLSALVLSFARSAILAVLFAAIVGFCIRVRLVNIILPLLYGLIFVAVLYLAKNYRYIKYRPDYDQTYMRENYDKHLIATFKGQDLSTMERVYRWVAAAKMSAVHPLTGFGPHSFISHYKSYTAPEFRTYVSANPERSTTHNYFLYVLTEQGWPAMLLYAILYIVIFAQAQCTYHRHKDRFYRLCTMGVVMMLAAGFINNMFSELIETHKAGALFYLPLALLIILKFKSEQRMNAGILSAGDAEHKTGTGSGIF